jgi:hypothetical protein
VTSAASATDGVIEPLGRRHVFGVLATEVLVLLALGLLARHFGG